MRSPSSASRHQAEAPRAVEGGGQRPEAVAAAGGQDEVPRVEGARKNSAGFESSRSSGTRRSQWCADWRSRVAV